MTYCTARYKLATGEILETTVEATTPIEAIEKFWATLADALKITDDPSTPEHLYTGDEIAEMQAAGIFVSFREHKERED
jgi:hypothetical protein